MATSSAATSGEPQVDEVERILVAANFFARLSLPVKETNSVTIRKRYRRVALRCHPDKVPHPKAKEAFQKLSEAFDCLHDDVQQAMYIEKLRDRVEAAKIRAKKKAARMKRKQWNKPKTNAYRHTAAGAAGAAGATSGGAAAAGSSGKAKKRKKQSKQAGKGGASGPKKWYEKTRSWIEVEAELRRREEAEARLRAQFRGHQSRVFSDRALLAFHRRMQQICQTLDERKGLPRHELWLPKWTPAPSHPLDRLQDGGRSTAEAASPPPPPTAAEARTQMEALLAHLHSEHDYRDLDDEYFEHAWQTPGSDSAGGGSGGAGQKKQKVYDY